MHHEHGGAGGHSHGEPQGGPMTPEKAEALLRFMHTHNVQHAEELHRLAHGLRDEGLDEAAGHVSDALECYRRGNENLETALDALDALMLTQL